jgi:hypothetical protein
MSIRNSSAFSIGSDKRGNTVSSTLIALQSYGLHKGANFIASKDIVEAPGPGQYTPKDSHVKGKINPSWSLSKDERDKKYGPKHPGPGEYKIPTKIGEAPQYIMGLKLQQNVAKGQEHVPGPANYNPTKSQTTL